MSDTKAARAKLSAARTRLILEHPFIGALVMHLPLEAADSRWCETLATDARAVYFNPEYVDTLDLAQAQFVLAHEAMHCALGHFARRSHRTVHRWDVACDYAVNLLLLDEGLKPPPSALVDANLRGLSAEEIYPLLPADPPERTLDRHIAEGPGVERLGGWHGGSSSADEVAPPAALGVPDVSWDDAGNEAREGPAALPRSLPYDEREALARQWKGRMVAAAQQARHAGRLPSSWLRLIDGLIEPQLPWRVILARYLMSASRDDYSYQRLSRREGAALLPRLASGEADVCVALDTSSSITPTELAEFAAEVDSLKSQIRARVTLLACDERLDERCPWRFQAWEPLLLPKDLKGGGGTSFVPVFEWIERERHRPNLVVYFTDAEGEFPGTAPEYPVVWLVKGRGRVPWGERIQLN